MRDERPVECCDNPRFYFCECVGVEAEGTVSVIALCTTCGAAKATRITVAQGPSQIRLLSEERKQKER